MFDGKSFAAEVVTLVKGYVQQSVKGLGDTVAALTERTAALEARPPAKDGKDGEPGEPGRAPTPEEIATAVKAALAENPPAVGEPGKDAEPVSAEQITKSLTDYFAANPPQAGKDGEPGKPGESVKGDTGRGVVKLLTDASGNLVVTYSDGTVESVGPLPRGADGKSFDASEVAELRRLVTEQKAIPAAEPIDLTVPDDVCELVSKAAAILAEPPPPIDRSSQPLVVNVGGQQSAQKGVTRKTMTMRPGANGEAIIELIEREVA